MEHYYEEECFTDFDTEFPAIILGSTNAISSQTSQGTTMREYEVEKEDSKIEFPAIFLSDSLTSKTTLSHEPTVSLPCKNKINFRISFDESDDEDTAYQAIRDRIRVSNLVLKGLCPSPLEAIRHMAPLPHYNLRHPWLKYQVEGYTEDIVHDFERRIKTIWDRSVNRVHILDFEGLTPEMRQDLAMRLRMVYTSEDGQQVFMSHAWRRLFGIRAPLVLRRSMTWRQCILVLGLHTEQKMAHAGFGAYWTQSERIIPDKGDLRDYWIEISSDRDFLGAAPTYVHIRDHVRRLCHTMIAYTISGKR
ncbi:hypothetical protein Tco_0317424 [Tanacetum coccineum]